MLGNLPLSLVEFLIHRPHNGVGNTPQSFPHDWTSALGDRPSHRFASGGGHGLAESLVRLTPENSGSLRASARADCTADGCTRHIANVYFARRRHISCSAHGARYSSTN